MRVAPIPEMRIIRCSLRGPRWSRVVVAAERSARRPPGLFEGGANCCWTFFPISCLRWCGLGVPLWREIARKVEAVAMVAEVRVRRVYDEPEDDDGVRVLVDRLWP